ncbi:hypothetical protein [Methylophaga sp. OBS3]|uniref:hypothetical protein n=1 Tax=Methylophaga sp. OBS3 TaxID=2991934 RepID=UPI0022578C80|nr:hypothetical protein [Methylophaga sp. OBS3]MCX4190816.1 hypothetical protein [Methylophaga sp. OBS3]
MAERIPSPELPHRLISQKLGKATIWISGGSEEIYLVNNSGRTIKNIRASVGGFVSGDDVSVPYSSESKYSYIDVHDGEAVLVEKLDGYYDLDYVHQLFLELEDEHLGQIELTTLPDKGKIKTQALFWENDIPSEKLGITQR